MATSRSQISGKIRFEVFKRDGFKCQYCGSAAPDVILHVDHVRPIASDGDNDIGNLITACAECNLGKGPRELSGRSAIEKQRKQLEELNERRLQLEMMIEWRAGLTRLEDQKVDAVASMIEGAAECKVTAKGRDSIRLWLRKYSVEELLLAADEGKCYLDRDGESFTSESRSKYFEFIPRIAAVKRREQDKPYLKDLYYIRGILRKRLPYVNEWLSITVMESAVAAGIETDEIRELALSARSWTAFQHEVQWLINQAGG
jgi:hypothetical protein